MIAAHDEFPNSAFAKTVNQGMRDQEIIEAPSNVLGAGVHHVRPKGIGATFVRIQMAKRVDHLRVRQHFGKSLALLR